MFTPESSFLLNVNSIGLIPTIVINTIFLCTMVVFNLTFKKSKLLNYALHLQITNLLISILFLILVNSTNPIVIFHLSIILYLSFLFITSFIVFTLSLICNFPFTKSKIFSVFSIILIGLLSYSGDSLLFTRSVHVTTYYSLVKGPVFPIFLVYATVQALLIINESLSAWKNAKDLIKQSWPIYVSLIISLVYNLFLLLNVILDLDVQPFIFIPSLSFSIFIMVYLFSNVRNTIGEQEKMYLNYIYDEETKVHSRAFILDQIRSLIETYSAKNLGLHGNYIAIIDIDSLKSINDNYGHEMGNQLLHDFGKLLLELKPDHFQVGRLGGDEFILLSEQMNYVLLEETIEDLLLAYQDLLAQLNLNNLHNEMGISIGIVSLNDEHNLETALTIADHNMYLAKQKGKNNYVVSA